MTGAGPGLVLYGGRQIGRIFRELLMRVPCIVPLVALVVLAGHVARGDETDEAMAPKETIRLFNGTDLNGWTTWLVDTGREDPRGGWYSSRYGRIQPAPCLSLSLRTGLPFFSATLLFPFKGATAPNVLLALDDRCAVVRAEETGEVRIRASVV